MLVDIIAELAAGQGINVLDPFERNLLVSRVNAAAQEIHENTDIQEALQEGVFDVNVDSQQISVPSYVYQIRGMRYYDGFSKINANDIKNRYNSGFGNEVYAFDWRLKRVSPVQREIANESILIVSIPLVEQETFEVTITGATENSTRTSETLVFSPGDLTKTTVLNFKEPLDSITKDIVTKYDVCVNDIEGNLLAVIPNIDKKVLYRIFQIWETNQTGASSSAVELLYKIRFNPAKEDQDSFWGTDKYDRAIIWKYLEHNTSDLTLAASFQFKHSQVMNAIQSTEQTGVREKINFKPSPFLDLPYARQSDRLWSY
jgi:hypothetical protein